MQEAEDSKMDDKPLYMSESDDIETDSQEDQEEYLCDGCGSPAIRTHFGFNQCERCDEYKVRGLSRRDFF